MISNSQKGRRSTIILIPKSIRIFAIFLIIFLAGCSTSSSSPSESLILFSENIRSGNYTETAKYVSSLTAAENKTDIPTFLALMSKEGNPDNISKWTNVEVISEKIDGTKAWVKIKVTVKPDGQETTYDTEIPMSKEDNVWKLHLTLRGYVKD